ncbi:MAG TPA: hypothetical protein VHC72_21775 [Bryobacteraceae bacterium]|nr:hypothetical protein [Bryobacteraceae bacterium]
MAAICAAAFRHVDLLWLEALFFIIVLATGFFIRQMRPSRWGRNPWLAFLIPALTSVILRTALLPWIPIPHPVVPDEFSHILLAKTFLLGRLANPAHPLWQHFESIHILSQPTYSSMYMPGQACFLAFGQLLFGNFFWGVVLSTALFCGTLTWFLRAYVPPDWALFGGLLAAVRIGAASYWNNSYWGGSAGALGGAMVLGAYPRLLKTWKPVPALIFAFGLMLLASTRPYEGAILGGVLVCMLLWSARVFVPRRQILRACAIVATVLLICGSAMTREWKAVTGHALTMPYQLNQQVYGWPTTLPWMKVRRINYRHPEFALYQNFETAEHRQITVPAEIPIGLVVHYSHWWQFLIGITLTPIFLFTDRILKWRRARDIWIAGAFVTLAVMTEQSAYPHYWSPAAAASFLFIVQGLRYLAQTRFGSALARFAIPVSGVLIVAHAATLSPAPPRTPNFISWCCTEVRIKDREPVAQQLEAVPGEHLVFVSYNLKSYDTFEWVYNEPDIDHARIVWARDLGAEQNQELIRYYPNRRVWQVRVSKNQPATLTALRRESPADSTPESDHAGVTPPLPPPHALR